jgi:hypothetical protein
MQVPSPHRIEERIVPSCISECIILGWEIMSKMTMVVVEVMRSRMGEAWVLSLASRFLTIWSCLSRVR